MFLTIPQSLERVDFGIGITQQGQDREEKFEEVICYMSFKYWIKVGTCIILPINLEP
jgi:hypothetical protein